MEIRGGHKLTIVRQLADPSDTNTYYVRAVIVNSATGSIIQVGGNDYVNLTDNGDQRFSYTWSVPYQADEFQIDIKTTVYTDSGYTTKSNRYAIENKEYIIRRKNLGGGGGGGVAIDYKKIKNIVEGIEYPKYDEVLQKMSDTLLLGLEQNRRAIDKIEIPKYNEKMLIEAINKLKEYIDSIEIPETDYKPLMSEIEGLKKGIEQSTKKLNDKSDNLEKSYSKFKESIKETVDSVDKNLGYIVKTFNLSELCDKFSQFMTGKKEEITKPSISDRVNNYKRKV